MRGSKGRREASDAGLWLFLTNKFSGYYLTVEVAIIAWCIV